MNWTPEKLPPSMRAKYGNKRVFTDDGYFDSKRELKRWQELKLLAKVGEISGLDRQVSFELIPKTAKSRASYYIADFVYVENGQRVVEDCKGFRDKTYMLKRKLMLWRHGIEIRES